MSARDGTTWALGAPFVIKYSGKSQKERWDEAREARYEEEASRRIALEQLSQSESGWQQTLSQRPSGFKFSALAAEFHPTLYPQLLSRFSYLETSPTRHSDGSQDIRALNLIEMPPHNDSNQGESRGTHSNDFIDNSELYHGQQPMYGPVYDYPQSSGYDEQSFHTYGAQTPYATQMTYDHSTFDQSAYPQAPRYGTHQAVRSGHQHSEHTSRAAAARIPGAVKGTPSYDVRMAVLKSQANEAFLTDFYNWNVQNQQSYLDRHFGAVEALSASVYDNQTIPSGIENRPPVGSSSTAAIVPRDPAPYTGFNAGNKRSSPRTVLHDPIAHQTTNQSHSAATASTLQDLLESSEALPSIPGAHDSTSPTYDTAPVNSRVSYSSLPFSNRLLEALDRITRPDALDRYIARAQEVKDMLDARDASQRGIPNAEHPEPDVIAVDSTQSNTPTGPTHPNTAIDSHQPGVSRQMPQVQYTATGLPIPHGGFADFKTPYNQNFMGTWVDFPEPFASEAARTAQQDSLMKDRTNDPDADLAKKATWFRTAPSAKDLELQTVSTELKARSDQIIASNIAAGLTAAGTPKPLPKPIGHERATTARRLVGTTSVTTSNLMNNPTAQGGMDLMSGTIANLMGYANGKDIGGHFANWTRPAEHAIDKSSDGNKSVFDKNWGSPPARVGRDPRYQQTMTTDGRATYFEDPARGMGRQ